MDSLELVRKLYEGEVDLAALEKDLDDTAREELHHLLEAKDALSALPRRRPSAGIVDAVVANAGRPEKPRSTLTLILTNRPLQRLAAAAVVVVAVGVGYLALRTDGLLSTVDQAFQVETKTEAPEDASQLAVGEDLKESEEPAEEAGAMRREMAELRANKPDARAPVREAPPAAVGGQLADKLQAASSTERSLAKSRDDFDNRMSIADAEGAELDTALNELPAETHELLTWDEDEEALRTFFWQVRALDERSPDDDWDEAVPLEGSFEQLEKQQPGVNRWLQTGSER